MLHEPLGLIQKVQREEFLGYLGTNVVVVACSHDEINFPYLLSKLGLYTMRSPEYLRRHFTYKNNNKLFI